MGVAFASVGPMLSVAAAPTSGCPASAARPSPHLFIDLSRFGLANGNRVFPPTGEPHGRTERVVARE
jgi:hypothetical protein